MRPVLLAIALIAATPALAQIRAVPEAHILRNAPSSIEEDTPAAAPPVNLRPTQLLRCPDGKGGISLQDTPCKPTAATLGTSTASASEVIDLAALPPRPQVEAPVPRVEDRASSRWTQGMLYGAGKLALLLAAAYAVYRFGRYARDRFRQRFAQPEMPSRVPRRVR
ncbi:MAG: hypothetical protein ABIQ06_00345 [Caldimonas sp.]